jgi:hypothetical protein
MVYTIDTQKGRGFGRILFEKEQQQEQEVMKNKNTLESQISIT